jgi:hypothetical protein
LDKTLDNQPQVTAISFQAYLTNIQAKTGKSPADFRALAEKKGFTQNSKLAPGVKAGAIVKWLKADFSAGPRPCNGHLRLAQGDESRNRSLRQDRELIEPH